jgi:cytochrome P450
LIEALLRPYSFFRRGTRWVRLPGLGRVLVTSDPKIAREIAVHPDLVGGRAHRAMRATLGEDHLIVLWGEAHRERRRRIFPALHGFQDDALTVSATREVMARTPRSFSMHAVMHEVALLVMVRALFGRSPFEAEILAGAIDFQRSFTNPLMLFLAPLRRDWGSWSPWGRLLRRRNRLVDLLQRATEPGSLAETVSGGDELLALLMFGHETTAGTLAWAFAHLEGHPGAAERIRSGDQAFTVAFLEESQRLCPAVAQLTRVAERDTTVGGHLVSAGTTVMPAVSLSDGSSCPFGLGNRICPGKAMAMRQMVVTMETVLADWNVKLPPGYRPTPVRQLFLVVPRGGTPMLR